MSVTHSSKKVAIIGSGIAGIATAIRLASKGHQVDVFESNPYPGGKLSERHLHGYRFDAGPSLFTLPQLVDELFSLCGENPEDHFQYQRIDVLCKYFFDDGTIACAYSDENKLIDEFSKKFDEPKKNIIRILKRSAFLYRNLSEMFMSQSLHDPKTYLSKNALKAYRNLHRFDFFRTMDKANRASLRNPKLIQIMNRYATYNGSNPYQTPATMNIIPHLEYGIGGFFPKKGMHHITETLVSLAKRQGVNFWLNQRVNRIVLDKHKVVGIEISGENKSYERVVSNMDITGTYRKLLPNLDPPKRLLKQPKSSSAIVFYWGIKGSFKGLDLHNIFFSHDYRAEFEAIFNNGTLYIDPTIYVNITSKYNKKDAPKGCENWFVMINAPNNQGQNWDVLISHARQNILTKLAHVLGQNIENLIEAEDVLDPRSIESRTSSSLGALYGNSSNNKYAAFLRHANFSHKVEGLYFCGGSVHPGGGIPMCLSSAKIVDRYFR
jgi:phytoene desaturase